MHFSRILAASWALSATGIACGMPPEVDAKIDLNGYQQAIRFFELEQSVAFTPADGVEIIAKKYQLRRLDPWGNPYHLKFDDGAPPQFLGAYSCGRDGVSDSEGSDEDDISTWGGVPDLYGRGDRIILRFMGPALLGLCAALMLLVTRRPREVLKRGLLCQRGC